MMAPNVEQLFDTWRTNVGLVPSDATSDAAIDTTAQILGELNINDPEKFDDPEMDALRATIQSLVEIIQAIH